MDTIKQKKIQYEKAMVEMFKARGARVPDARVGGYFHTCTAGEYNTAYGWGAWLGYQSRDAEINQLREDLAGYEAGAAEEARQGDIARAECKQLREENEMLKAFADSVTSTNFFFNEFQGMQARLEMKLSGLLKAAKEGEQSK